MNSPYYRGKYNPSESRIFKLSRSKVELFHNCQRCFYLDRRLGIKRPSSPPFNINSAVDTLLKSEFDYYRFRGEKHPYLIENNIKAYPFNHPDLEEWRQNFKGVKYHHEVTNLLLFGAVDDIWVTEESMNTDEPELIVVDYKATSKNGEVSLDAAWQISYKRQMEFYQYLLRKNGFKVSNTGYFVYCNGDADKRMFDNTMHFDVKLIPYTGNDNWVEPKVQELYECLQQDKIPASDFNCEHCQYFKSISVAFSEQSSQLDFGD